MSIPGYGRLVPLQFTVLELGGVYLSRAGDSYPATDDERLKVMKYAYVELKETTKQDFGFDLKAWHDYLLSHSELQKDYKFSYAWDAVKEKVESLFECPDRLRLVALLNKDAG